MWIPGHNSIAGNEKQSPKTHNSYAKKITLLKYGNNIDQNRRLNSMKLKCQNSRDLLRHIAPETRNNNKSSQNKPLTHSHLRIRDDPLKYPPVVSN